MQVASSKVAIFLHHPDDHNLLTIHQIPYEDKNALMSHKKIMQQATYVLNNTDHQRNKQHTFFQGHMYSQSWITLFLSPF